MTTSTPTATKTDRRCPAGGAHHLVFETPNGPLARGACKKCGLVEERYNSLPADRLSGWQDITTSVGGWS